MFALFVLFAYLVPVRKTLKFMPKKKIKEMQTAKPKATPKPSASNVIIVTRESLLGLAAQEENRRELSEFSDVITLLRNEKNFTFREIAGWLSDHTGMQIDHNAVYREYTSGMPQQLAEVEEMSDKYTEWEESGQQ